MYQSIANLLWKVGWNDMANKKEEERIRLHQYYDTDKRVEGVCR